MKHSPASMTSIVGRKPVLEAIASDSVIIESVYVKRDLNSPVVPKLRQACKRRHIPIKFVPQQKLDQIAEGALHQGVVALTSAIEMYDIDSMLAEIAPMRDDIDRLKPLLLILDRISDPHNLGAIVRSATAFGCSGIILPERNTAPVGSTAIKASAGTALNARFARVVNLAQTVRQLKERGYWVTGLSANGNVTLNEVDWDRPTVLVVGSESDGIGELVERECDLLVSIPIAPDVESLNASVAAGIALQAASRVRTTSVAPD